MLPTNSYTHRDFLLFFHNLFLLTSSCTFFCFLNWGGRYGLVFLGHRIVHITTFENQKKIFWFTEMRTIVLLPFFWRTQPNKKKIFWGIKLHTILRDTLLWPIIRNFVCNLAFSSEYSSSRFFNLMPWCLNAPDRRIALSYTHSRLVCKIIFKEKKYCMQKGRIDLKKFRDKGPLLQGRERTSEILMKMLHLGRKT